MAPTPSVTRDEPLTKLQQLHPRRFFLDVWRQMDAEARKERAARRKAGDGYDIRPLVALCLGAALLLSMKYYGGTANLEELVELLRGEIGLAELRRSDFRELYSKLYWSGFRFFVYLVIPAIVIRFVFKERVRDHGLSTDRVVEHLWIYLLAYAIVLVAVVAVSYTDSFSRKYPMYSLAGRSWFDFFAWELAYVLQFFCLEFFFRGHWLAALKPSLGSHAIFVMVAPYCLIHYGKPFAEGIGAIVAGVVLGTLAMSTRSIYNGFFIHASVGISMDVAALLQRGGLPDRWWPG